MILQQNMKILRLKMMISTQVPSTAEEQVGLGPWAREWLPRFLEFIGEEE